MNSNQPKNPPNELVTHWGAHRSWIQRDVFGDGHADILRNLLPVLLGAGSLLVLARNILARSGPVGAPSSGGYAHSALPFVAVMAAGLVLYAIVVWRTRARLRS
jgi:hypothetical protein